MDTRNTHEHAWTFHKWENLSDLPGPANLRAIFHQHRDDMVIMGVPQAVVPNSEMLNHSELVRLVRGEEIDTPVTRELAQEALSRYRVALIMNS